MNFYAFCAVMAALIGYIALSVKVELALIQMDFEANAAGKRLPWQLRRQSGRLVYRVHSVPEDVQR